MHYQRLGHGVSVAALSHLGRERQFGGPVALSKVHWVRPSLNGMQNAVGPEGFDGFFEGEAAMEAKPFAGVPMPLNIKAVEADPVEAGEGRIGLCTRTALDRFAGKTWPSWSTFFPFGGNCRSACRPTSFD